MEKTVYLVFGLTCFLVAAHYLTKILDWNTKRKAFKDNKTEFIADLYKLQEKWAKKGEFDISQGINTLILHFSIPKEPDAATAYGRDIQKKLKDLEEDEQP